MTTVEKFVNSLDRRYETVKSELVQKASKRYEKKLVKKDDEVIDLLAQLNNVKRLITIPREEWEKHGEIFISFRELSAILDETDLNIREKIEIIMQFFELNLATNMLDSQSYCYDSSKVADYQFQYITYKEFQDFMRSGKFRELYNKSESELTEEERLIIKEVVNATDGSPFDASDIIKQHRIIKEHYFDKYPNISKKDVDEVSEVLKKYGLAENLLLSVKSYLYGFIDKMERKAKKQSEAVSTKETVKKTTVVQPTRSREFEKEYNAANRELKSYYDIDNDVAIRELTLEEQVICVHLLQRMHVSSEKINEILNKINKLSSKHPIAMYAKLYDKFAYYKENEEVSKVLNELEIYFAKLFAFNDEEYEIIKMYFKDGIDKMLELIPGDYHYEHENAKRVEFKK